MKEFGQSCYDSFVYFNFDEEDELKSIFEANKNPQRIIELLSMIAEKRFCLGETLVIFDEVRGVPRGPQHTQIFQRESKRLPCHRCRKPAWHPSGPAEVLPGGGWSIFSIYTPFIFDEFLEATDPALFAYYESIQKDQTIEEIFHNRLLEAYNYYLIIGGDAGMRCILGQP